MVDQNNSIQIEKMDLSEVRLDSQLCMAFSTYESKNIEFGLDWLINLAQNALSANEKAILYIARNSSDDFLACPLKLDSKSNQASALSTFYTSLYTPIVHSNDAGTLLNALFNYLATSENVTSLTLQPIDMDSALFPMIQESLKQSGWRGVHSYTCFGNWSHVLNEQTYQSYFDSLSSRQKNTVKRKSRRFLAGGKGQLQIVENEGDLEQATAQFIAIYSNSWKRGEPYPEFIPNLLQVAAQRGWLRLGIASYDTVPVAAQIWLVSNGTAHIFKLAYDENYKKLSPGTVLTACLMEHVIDVDRVRLIDYLTGDDSYKQDWMTIRKERRGIAAYNTLTTNGMSKYLMYKIKKTGKKLLAI